MILVEMGTLELKQILNGHRGRVWNICWHPKGTCLASCGEDKKIIIWEPEEPKWVIKTILTEGHTRTIREIAWSHCGNYIASTSFDGTTAIWDKKSGQFECNATLEGHENEVKSVSWFCNGQLLATCSRDKSVWVWEVRDDEYDCAAVINAHTQDVKKVRWHPHEEILASASYDNTIKIFKEDMADSDWSCVATLSAHTSTVWSLAWDKTGSRIATCSDDQTVKIWQEYKPNNEPGIVTVNNEPVWKCVCTLTGYHTRTIYDIDWCKITGLLVTACGDDTIRIFKEDENSDPHEPSFFMVCSMENAHSQDVNCVQWNPSVPGQLASASDDGTMFKQLIGLRVASKTLNFNVIPKLYCPQLTMSTQEANKGVPLNKVVDVLEKFAEPSLAADWDNVGLLVEPTDEKIVSQILLTNDLTENVMQEALDLKTDMIITYHPLIFAPLKSVTTRSWKERIVAKCLENKIAVYSPHTSFDSVQGGVNDWLASAFKTVLGTTTPIQPDKDNSAYGMGRLCTLKDKITIGLAVQMIKQHTNLKHVRLARARPLDGYIKRIALCAGSGVSVLKGVPADLYVTGEMLHHDVLDAVHDGAHVILTNHSDSERGFLKEFASTLRTLLQNCVNVHVSESDADPLETV